MNLQNDFFSLSPDHILEAVEQTIQLEDPTIRATGRSLALNSLENRVYDVELEDESHIVAKFYRPGRWTTEQIQEEHDFLFALEDAEIPVVAPWVCGDHSLFKTQQGIHFALFPKVKGRLKDELSKDDLKTLGRYIARIHNVGEHLGFRKRLVLTAEQWGHNSIDTILASDHLPNDYRARYEHIARGITSIAAIKLAKFPSIALHGDCHLGNTLWQQDSPFFLDFDDAVQAPAMQDIWMVVRGRGEEAEQDRDILLEGYSAFRPFDRRELCLLEPLRALRMIHYSAWISRRWNDPSFPQAFPLFGSARYWSEEVQSLSEIFSFLEET